MSFPPFFSLKNQLIAISLSLIVILLLRFCDCYSCSFSSTLLILVLPNSFPFIFSKIKLLIVSGSMKETTPESKLGLELSPEEEKTAEENKAAQEEVGELHNDEIVLNGGCPSLEGPVSDENLENLCCSSLSEKSDCSLSEDKLASSEIAGSEGSVSDDESLIEIALEDEPNAVFQRELKGGFLPEFLPEFSPELLFRKHGLMELLSEINEEDNMIEIDIAMGSIKCSRFEIKA